MGGECAEENEEGREENEKEVEDKEDGGVEERRRWRARWPLEKCGRSVLSSVLWKALEL